MYVKILGRNTRKGEKIKYYKIMADPALIYGFDS